MTEPIGYGKAPRRPGVLWFAAYGLMIFGIVFTTMKVVGHLKREPREPLLFDLTLRRGDGGFIVYGIALTLLGIALLVLDAKRRRRTA